MLNLLKRIIFKNSSTSVRDCKTFTYFIPASKPRSSGYQEKEFDNLINKLTNNGVEILSITTETCSAPNNYGMWVICLVKSKSPITIENLQKTHDNTNETIDGLYYIDE